MPKPEPWVYAVAAVVGVGLLASASRGKAPFKVPPLPPKSRLTDAEIANRIHAAYRGKGAMNAVLARAIVITAHAVKADPFALANLINLESGFDPAIENGQRATVARDTGCVKRKGRDSGGCGTGLIQFMPDTARDLGTTVQAIKRMPALRQMVLVERYLRRAARGHDLMDPANLYVAVFYPAWIGKPDRVFSAKIQRDNPGIRTPRDYITLVDSKARLPTTVA